MAGGLLGEPRRPSSVLYGHLHGRLVGVVKDLFAGSWVGARPRGGKEILPGEAFCGVRHFLTQRMGQVDLAAAGGELRVVAHREGIELGAQLIARAGREQRWAVVLPFSTAYHDLPPLEVDILHADRHGFKRGKAASVKKLAYEAKEQDEVLEQGDDLVPRDHHGEVIRSASTFERFEPGNLQIEDPCVEEEQGATCLILRGH